MLCWANMTRITYFAGSNSDSLRASKESFSNCRTGNSRRLRPTMQRRFPARSSIWGMHRHANSAAHGWSETAPVIAAWSAAAQAAALRRSTLADRVASETLGICGTLCDIGRATDRDWALIDPTHPTPDRVPVPALFIFKENRSQSGIVGASRLRDFEIL
jgi:hypothetical protein